MKGTVLRGPDHQCWPPGSYKFGNTHRKACSVHDVGTLWRCNCGNAWECVDGFWAKWERAYQHDGPPVEKRRWWHRKGHHIGSHGHTEGDVMGATTCAFCGRSEGPFAIVMHGEAVTIVNGVKLKGSICKLCWGLGKHKQEDHPDGA